MNMDFLSNPEFWIGLAALVSMIIGGSKSKMAGGERFKIIRRVSNAIKKKL